MLELRSCCEVPYPEKLFEGYELTDNAIHANVNASKVLSLMKRFIEMHNERMFFILELPCREEDGITESKTLLHANQDYDVFFIDGLQAEDAYKCLDSVGDFLLKDGMSVFGFGGHDSNEEILFGKYNILTLRTQEPVKYHSLFREFGLKQTNGLITAWDTFDADHPGKCTTYVSAKSGLTVYDIPDIYEEYGMYLYESRKTYSGAWEKTITYEELVGKVLLVGITYYTDENEFIEQKQFYGTVVQADLSAVRIQQKDGSLFSLPPDLSSTKRARPGEYKLRATGEVVVDPDFLATWYLMKNKK